MTDLRIGCIGGGCAIFINIPLFIWTGHSVDLLSLMAIGFVGSVAVFGNRSTSK